MDLNRLLAIIGALTGIANLAITLRREKANAPQVRIDVEQPSYVADLYSEKPDEYGNILEGDVVGSYGLIKVTVSNHSAQPLTLLKVIAKTEDGQELRHNQDTKPLDSVFPVAPVGRGDGTTTTRRVGLALKDRFLKLPIDLGAGKGVPGWIVLTAKNQIWGSKVPLVLELVTSRQTFVFTATLLRTEVQEDEPSRVVW